MDPITAVGAVASVVQLAGAAYQLSKTLYSFGSAVGSANDDLHDLADDLKIFSQSLTLLSRLLEDSKAWYSDDIYILTAKIIKDCAELYVKIDKILAKLGGNSKNNWKMRVKFVYKEGQIRKLLKRLRDMKGTLATILMSLQVDLQLSLLNISSSSKIQRQPERPLQPDTIKMLNDAQKAVNTNEVVSRYTSQSEPQLAEKSLEISSTYIDQETRPSMFNSFVVFPIPAKNPTVYSSEGTLSFGMMPGKSPAVVQRHSAIHSKVDRTPNHHTESNPDISIRRSISVDSFKSAVSTQEGKSEFMEKIDAVQGVLHAFQTALETLENLVLKRHVKYKGYLDGPAHCLRLSLRDGETKIGAIHKSHYTTHGRDYIRSFEKHHGDKLQEISSNILKEIVLVLHTQSAEHVVLSSEAFISLYRQSESYRKQTISTLCSVASVGLRFQPQNGTSCGIEHPEELNVAQLSREGLVRHGGLGGCRGFPGPNRMPEENQLDPELLRLGVSPAEFYERFKKNVIESRDLRAISTSTKTSEMALRKREASARFRQQRHDKDTAWAKTTEELVSEKKALLSASQRGNLVSLRGADSIPERKPGAILIRRPDGDPLIEDCSSQKLPTDNPSTSSADLEAEKYGAHSGSHQTDIAAHLPDISQHLLNTNDQYSKSCQPLSGSNTMNRNIWWSGFRKATWKNLDASASEDLIDLDVADPETIKDLKIEDRVAPRIPGSSPPKSPSTEAEGDLGLKRNPDSAPGNTDLREAPEMTLPYIGYTFKRFEQTTRAGDPSSTIEPPSIKNDPSPNYNSTLAHGETLPNNDDTEQVVSKEAAQPPKTTEQRRKEILEKKAKLHKLQNARAERTFKGEIIEPLVYGISGRESTARERRMLDPNSTEFRPSPYTNLGHNDVGAVVSGLSEVGHGLIGIGSDALQDVNPKQAHRILMRRQLRETLENDLQQRLEGSEKSGVEDEVKGREGPQDSSNVPSPEPSFHFMSSLNPSTSTTRQEDNTLDANPSYDSSGNTESAKTHEDNSKDLTSMSSRTTPESEPTMDQSCREATAIYHFQPASGSNELIMRRGQNIWIDLSIPCSNDWYFATDEWKRSGWVPASYIRFLESIAINNSTPISAQSNTTHHDISNLPQGQQTLREGLWWKAYLILHTDNESKELLSLDRALSYEFGTLTSKFISDKLIRERISILLSRADSASHEFSTVFAQATEMRKHRAMVINILKTIEKSPFGFNVAMLGWCCVTVFLALYDPLFTNKSSPTPNLTASKTQTLTQTFEQLKEITSIIARYAVKENIFSQKGNMTLEPEYKDALIDLAVTIFRWFGNAFEVWRRFSPGLARGDGSEEFCGRLVEEIYRKEEACARFRVVCGVEGDEEEVDEEEGEESSESEESDGDWEKVTDELTEEGVILDEERLDEKKLAVLAANF